MEDNVLLDTNIMFLGCMWFWCRWCTRCRAVSYL